MLWACVLLPRLPLEVYTRGAVDGADAPVAIVTAGHHPRVVTVNDAADDAGLRPLQLVTAALALAPEVVLRERDPGRERTALRAVATGLMQFTPTVSIGEPDAVLAEIGGSARLFGGLDSLLRQIATHVEALGYSVRLACAPTATAARLLARAGESAVVVQTGDLPRRLAPVPLEHLDADPRVVQLLGRAGIATFGEACALPRDALARRTSPAFVHLLDRVRGLVADPQPPFDPPARYRGRLELPVPVADVEALAFAVNRLVHELSGWLLGRGLGVCEMTLSLEHERLMPTACPNAQRVARAMPATTVDFALAAPARDAAHLNTVLRERLARVELAAAVEAVVLASAVTAPLAGRNLGLLPCERDEAAVPLLDRLRARLGDDAVIRVAPLEDHRPERAWHAAGASDAASAEDRGRRPVDSPRPLWLLSEAQPLGATFEVKPWVLRDGPERIEAGWWDGSDIRRDYYVAESPRGELLWIYRDSVYGPDGEWFLQGVFS